MPGTLKSVAGQVSALADSLHRPNPPHPAPLPLGYVTRARHAMIERLAGVSPDELIEWSRLPRSMRLQLQSSALVDWCHSRVFP